MFVCVAVSTKKYHRLAEYKCPLLHRHSWHPSPLQPQMQGSLGTSASFSNWYFSYLLGSCLPISRPATVAQDPHLKQPGGLILSLVVLSLSPWRLAHPGLLKELHCIHIFLLALNNMPES